MYPMSHTYFELILVHVLNLNHGFKINHVCEFGPLSLLIRYGIPAECSFKSTHWQGLCVGPISPSQHMRGVSMEMQLKNRSVNIYWCRSDSLGSHSGEIAFVILQIWAPAGAMHELTWRINMLVEWRNKCIGIVFPFFRLAGITNMTSETKMRYKVKETSEHLSNHQ